MARQGSIPRLQAPGAPPVFGAGGERARHTTTRCGRVLKVHTAGRNLPPPIVDWPAGLFPFLHSASCGGSAFAKQNPLSLGASHLSTRLVESACTRNSCTTE